MALTNEQIQALRGSHEQLSRRIEGAFIKAAWLVLKEAPEITNHADRLVLAHAVLLPGSTTAKDYELFVLSNGTLQTKMDDSTDNELDYVVQTELFNTIADIVAA